MTVGTLTPHDGEAINLDDWIRSIMCLTYEINRIHSPNNMLAAAAAARSHFMFTDSSVPKPRPCTALAWASLCAFGPIQGFVTHRDGVRYQHEFDARQGRFLVPFLPRINPDEDTTQSLIRSSRLHARDTEGHIRWGNVYIGDSSTGEIVEQLSHGQFPASEFMDEHPLRSLMNRRAEQHEVPPLWACYRDGWQFGINQTLTSQRLTLRDPMIELARHGIRQMSFKHNNFLQVNRLLLRFLNVADARSWAKAYSESMPGIYDKDLFWADIHKLNDDVRESLKAQVIAATKPKGKRASALERNNFAKNEGFMASLNKLMDGP